MAEGTGFSDKSRAETGELAEGEKAKSFLDSMFTTNLGDTEKVERFGSGAHELKTWAENGQFAINEAGMRAYLKAIDLFLDGYKQQSQNLHILTKPMPLGSHAYGQEVSSFLATIWDGRENSLLPNLKMMKTAMEDAREALVMARKNYDESDEASSISFRNVDLDG